MARGGSTTRFDVIIAAKVKNEAAAGAAQTNSTVDKMLKQQLRAIEQANRAQAADAKRTAIEIAQVEAQQSRRQISSKQAAAKEFQKAEADKVRLARQSEREIARVNAQTARQAEQNMRAQERAAKSLADEKQRLIRREQEAFLRAEREKTAAVLRTQAAQKASADATSAAWVTAFGLIKTVAVATLAAIVAAGTGLAFAISRAMSFDVLERGLEIVAGSAQEAQKQLIRLKELARLPGLGLREAIEASIALQIGFQQTIKNTATRVALAEETIKQFSNAIALTGGGPEVFQRIITQLTQMSNAGKVLMTDLRPIIQAAPAIGQALVKAFGTIDPKEINALGLTTEQFMNRLNAALATLPRATDSAANAWTNFTNAFDQALIKIGKPFLEPLTRALNVLEPLLDRFGTRVGEIFTMIGQDAVKLWQGLPEMTRAQFTDMLNSVQSIGGGIVKWFQTNYGIMLAVVSNVLQQIANFWKTYGAQIKSIAGDWLTSVGKQLSLALQIMSGDWRKGWSTMMGIILLEGRKGLNAVILLVRLIWGAILSQKDLIRKTGMSLGEALLDGITAGIKARVFAPVNAAKGAAALIMQQFATIWQIRSPSRVAIGYGANLILGLVIGMASMQAQAVAKARDIASDVDGELKRLTIPERPTTTGKKGKAIREADKKSRPGFDLLEKLYSDIDQLAPAEEKTKALAVAAELAKVKYADLSVEVRKALDDAANYHDKQKALIDVQELFASTTEAAREELLKLQQPLGENATELERFELALSIATAKNPLFAASLAASRLELEKVRAALIAVDTARVVRKRQETASEMAKGQEALFKELAEQSAKDVADKAKSYADIIGGLNAQLSKNVELTQVQITQQKLEMQGLFDLNDARTQEALRIAAVIDQMEALASTREQVRRIAEDVSSVFSRAVENWSGSLGDFFKDIGRGFSDLLRRMVADLVQSKLSNVFEQVFSKIFGGGGGSRSGGGAGGGIFGVGGATPPFAGSSGGSTGGLGGILSGVFGMGGGSPTSLSAGLPGGGWGEMGRRLGFPGTGGAGTSMLGGIGSALGAMAPLLGVSLGVGLGGQSRFGQVLGGVGGGLIGLGVAGALGMLPAMLAGLAIPGAIFALPLIIGAVLLARNAQRKKDEKTRNQATIDTRSALWQILAAVQTDQMDGNSARSEISKLHQQWIEVGNGLKDSKTRRHHMETWNHFQPIIDSIEKEIGLQTTRGNNRNRMVPVFASGGVSTTSQLIKVTPGEGVKYPGSDLVSTVRGQDRGYDSEYMYAPKGTRIIPTNQMRQSRGFANGGVVGESGGSMMAPNIAIEINIDKDGIAHAVVTSPMFKPAVIHNVKVGRVEKKL